MSINDKLNKHLLSEGLSYSKTMLNAYLQTSLWSSNNDEGEPFDDEYTIRDIDKGSVKKAEKDIKSFLTKAKSLLDDVTADDSQFGHDFWLTRNGHGTGFWDRSKVYGKSGDKLTKIAEKKPFGNIDVYLGDDGKIYID